MIAGKPLYFTLDLEDHRPDPNTPKRYPEITARLLDFLEARGIAATVFVLGRVAREAPELVREIAARGHEIGFHSLAHRHLTDESPAALARELADNRALFQDLSDQPVNGYRAPAFSLTRESVWAVDCIAGAGFDYSSSVLPAKSPVFGFPGAPRKPFRWPNGLLEIPAPVAQIGPFVLPFLGGFYLRYLPGFVVHRCLERGAASQCYWMYCHPHDFDTEESFYRIEGTSWLTSALLWFNRGHTLGKIERTLDAAGGAASRGFASAIRAGEFDDAEVFTP